jgi:cellulose 1,4-beta-cellobiosidase
MALVILIVISIAAVSAQQRGSLTAENHPPLSIMNCKKSGGCSSEQSAVTVDANWRWLHSTSMLRENTNGEH